MTTMIDIHDHSTAAHQHTLDLEQRAALAALLERDPEGWASLRGLIAMLSLPPRGGHHDDGDRRSHVTVEVAPGVWQGVNRVYVRADAIVVAQGINGHSVGWTFPQPGPVPAWEYHKIAPVHGLPGDDLRR